MATANYAHSDTRLVLRYDIAPKRDRLQGEDGEFFRADLANRIETGLQIRIGDSKEMLGDDITRVNAPLGQRNVINFNDAYINPDPLGSFTRPYPVAASLLAPAIDVDLGKQTLKFDGTTVFVKSFSVVIGSRQDDRIVGDNNDNVLNGNAGADILIGREGNDVLIADYNDTLTGGEGNDRFRLTAALASFRSIGDDPSPNSPNVTITDFQPGQDRIQLARQDKVIDLGGPFSRRVTIESFDKFEKGKISADQFNLIESANEILGSADGLYYNTTNGDLFAKGADKFGLPFTRIATLTGAPTLTAKDIVVI